VTAAQVTEAVDRGMSGAPCRGVPMSKTGRKPAHPQPQPLDPVTGLPRATLHQAIEMATALIEQKMALEALKTTGWNVSRAAELLGISRRSLQLLMKRHGIKKTGSVAE